MTFKLAGAAFLARLNPCSPRPISKKAHLYWLLKRVVQKGITGFVNVLKQKGDPSVY